MGLPLDCAFVISGPQVFIESESEYAADCSLADLDRSSDSVKIFPDSRGVESMLGLALKGKPS